MDSFKEKQNYATEVDHDKLRRDSESQKGRMQSQDSEEIEDALGPLKAIEEKKVTITEVELKLMAALKCEGQDCGHNAICNACWLKKFASDILRKPNFVQKQQSL